jgi:hypothetical protein
MQHAKSVRVYSTVTNVSVVAGPKTKLCSFYCESRSVEVHIFVAGYQKPMHVTLLYLGISQNINLLFSTNFAHI